MEPKRSVVHQLQKLIFFFILSLELVMLFIYLHLFILNSFFFIHWKFCRFAVAFYGSSSRPQLVALVAQVNYCIFKVPLYCCMHEFIINWWTSLILASLCHLHPYIICHYYSFFFFCLSFEFLPYCIK